MTEFLKRFMYLFQLLSSGKMVVLLVATNLAIVLVFGGWFSVLENIGLLDSMYWSATTFFTIGYGDISPKTDIGKMMSFSYYLVSEAGRNFMTASLIAWLVNITSRATRGLSQVHGDDLLLIVNPVDQQHLVALLRAARQHNLWNDVVVISDSFTERPDVPVDLGRVVLVRGNPLDMATYQRANVHHATAAIICAASFNAITSDQLTAAIVKLIESIDHGRIVTVVEVLVADQLRWFQQSDRIVLADRAICRRLAAAVQTAAAHRSIKLQFRAFDEAKDAEFVSCLVTAGVQFQRVEDQADIVVIFASDLDNPQISDAMGLTQAVDCTAPTVIVEFLAIQHAHLFSHWQALCLDQVVAEAVVEELAMALQMS